MSIEPHHAARYTGKRYQRWRLPTPRRIATRAATAVAVLGCLISPGLALASAAATGTRVHVVRMVGDANGFRFEPQHLEIASGDTLVFEVASGQPHDVAFDTAGVAPATVRQLSMRVHDQIAPLAGPLLVKPGERYGVSFDGIAPGRYAFYCLPHQTLQMKGWVVVK
jgi:plastocyanin